MAEYMNCLNLAQAKLTVVERQHAIEAAEKAKKELSSSQTANVNLPFITVNADGPLHRVGAGKVRH